MAEARRRQETTGAREVPAPKAASERKTKADRKPAFGRAGEQGSLAVRQGLEWLFLNEMPIHCSGTAPDGSERDKGGVHCIFPASFDTYFGTVSGGAGQRARGGYQVIEEPGDKWDHAPFGKLFLPWYTDSWKSLAFHGIPALNRICVPKDESKDYFPQQIVMERAGYVAPLNPKDHTKNQKLTALNYSPERSHAAMKRAAAVGKLLEAEFGPWPERAAVKSKGRSGSHRGMGKAVGWTVRCDIETCGAHKAGVPIPSGVWDGMVGVTGKRGGPENIWKMCGHSRDHYQLHKVHGFPALEKPVPLSKWRDTVAALKKAAADEGKDAVERSKEAIAEGNPLKA
jgi:hypothetical protein